MKKLPIQLAFIMSIFFLLSAIATQAPSKNSLESNPSLSSLASNSYYGTFHSEIVYHDKCNDFGTKAYLHNRDPYNSYKVIYRVSSVEGGYFNSQSSDESEIIEAGEEKYLGCTSGGTAGSISIDYKIVGEVLWNK